MPTSRAELDAMLNRLQEALPAMMADNPDDGDFWGEFAGQAEIIEDAASAADCEHVHGRIDAVLSAQGLIPSEND